MACLFVYNHIFLARFTYLIPKPYVHSSHQIYLDTQLLGSEDKATVYQMFLCSHSGSSITLKSVLKRTTKWTQLWSSL